MASLNRIYAGLDAWRPQALGLLRIVAALLFLQHGLSKVIGFPSAGPPALSGLILIAAALETLGSLALLVGAYSRIVAFFLSGEMAVAYFTAHAPQSFYPLANRGESAILFCFIFLYLVFSGGGAWSVDRAFLKQS